MKKAFGQIKIRGENQREGEHLTLHFATREAYDTFRREHMKSVGTKIIDEFWGYSLFTNSKDAWEAVRAFCRLERR